MTDQLASLEHDGRTYWYLAETEPDEIPGTSAHLLQILDEIYRGYQDSRWVIDADNLVRRGREPAMAITLVDGQIAATMNRRTTADLVEFTLGPYRHLTTDELDGISSAAERYGAFLGLRPTISIVAPQA